MTRRDWLRRCAALRWPAPALAASLALTARAQQRLVALDADDAAAWLVRFEPVSGPVDAFASPRGAWWQGVFVRAAPGWPMELVLRTQRRSGHTLRLWALDATPADAPGQAVPMPLRADVRGLGQRWSSRFALPADGNAPGVFVRIELWRSDAAPPPSLAVQLRPIDGRHDGGRSSAGRVEAPPSPITQGIAQAQGLSAAAAPQALALSPHPASHDSGVVELPIWALRSPVDAGRPRLPPPR